jgi:hypothetical protein
MALPSYGYERAFGLGWETVSYGAAVEPDVWFRPTSISLVRKDPALEHSGPTGSQVAYLYDATLPRHWRGLPDCSGTVVCEAEYTDIGYILSNAFGTGATTTNDSPVAGTDTHVFTYPAATPASMPSSFTLAVINGIEEHRFVGCHINTLEISGAQDRLVQWSADFICQDGGDTDVADTIGTLSSDPWIEYSDADLLYNATVAGAPATEDSGKEAIEWTFRLENNLLARGGTGQGGRYIREPIYSGLRRATFTFTRDYQDNQWFNKMMSASEAATPGNAYCALQIKMTSIEYITGTTPWSLELDAPAVLILDAPVEYGGGTDVEPETITGVVAYDGSNAPCTATLVNDTNGAAYEAT